MKRLKHSVTQSDKSFDPHVVNTRITPNTIEKKLRYLAIKSNISKKCTVHTFRRTFGSILYRNTSDIVGVSELLGHASINTTRKFYIIQNKSDIKRMIKNY